MTILNSEKKIVSFVLVIQLFSAIVAFISPIFINSNSGSDFLADILYVYSLFVLTYSLSNFGIPEQIQVWRSKGGQIHSLYKSLLCFLLIITLLISVLFIANAQNTIILLILFCFNYILFESMCRIFNQDGMILLGQLMLSLFPILFWINALIDFIDISLSLFMISFLLSSICLIIIFFQNLKFDKKSKIKHLKPSYHGALKIYLTRVYASILDGGPLILMYHLNLNDHVVLYGLISRIIIPLSMLVQSFNSVFLRQKITGNFQLPKISPFFIFSIFIITSLLIMMLHYFTKDYLFNRFEIPIVLSLYIFAISSYRFAIFGFTIQNSWSIEKINSLSLLTLVTVPLILILLILIFFLLNLSITYFFILSMVSVIFLIKIFNKAFSLI